MTYKLILLLFCILPHNDVEQSIVQNLHDNVPVISQHNRFVEYEVARNCKFYKITLIDTTKYIDIYDVTIRTKWSVHYTPSKDSEYKKLIGFIYVKYAYHIPEWMFEQIQITWQQNDSNMCPTIVDIEKHFGYQGIPYLRNPYKHWRCKLVSRNYKYRSDWISFGEAISNLLDYELGYKNPKLEKQVRQLFPI